MAEVRAGRPRRLPLHREPLPDLRRGDGMPGVLHDRAGSVSLGARARRQHRTGRAHRVGRSPVRLSRDAERGRSKDQRRGMTLTRRDFLATIGAALVIRGIEELVAAQTLAPPGRRTAGENDAAREIRREAEAAVWSAARGRTRRAAVHRPVGARRRTRSSRRPTSSSFGPPPPTSTGAPNAWDLELAGEARRASRLRHRRSRRRSHGPWAPTSWSARATSIRRTSVS